ncbi:MAG: GNAT family N-acetyltransferase [Rugosibacter sp.]|nr:GNAT family N-acetyltransferase [Rugosibacter sp.]
MSGCPVDFSQSTFQSRSGAWITSRPIQPEDTEREQAFIKNLSPETRYRRFMSTLNELSSSQLHRFTHIDYHHTMAFIALLEETGEEIGVCRYAANPTEKTPDACEFAIVVADEWQGQGIGYHLMTRLIAAAREQGFLRMTGDFLADNTPMLSFVSRLSFKLSAHIEDHGLKHGELWLDSR